MKHKGVTLVELILFITLAGLFVAVFIPAVNISTVPFESAVEKLKHDIRYAQWMAMSRKIVYGVKFGVDNDEYSLFQEDPSQVIQDTFNPANPYVVNYASDPHFRDVDIVSVDIGGTDVVEFDGKGRPRNRNHVLLTQQGTIVLHFRGTDTTITIEPNTGRVSEQVRGAGSSCGGCSLSKIN